ncbi:MAG: hypothetical protein LBV58_00535 [Acholeplasmatales bacterium]|jgi:hypothetical protein|nr:hypothetical protein [Acholeplasmatales bacterium]
MNFFDSIFNFFNNIGVSINDFIKNLLHFDDLILGLYNDWVLPIPEIFKWLGLLFLAWILILGIISFVKKFIKLFIVIIIILAIVLLVTKLVNH